MLTEAQISAFECCALERISMVNAYANEGRSTVDLINENALFFYQVKFVREYIPNGTLLEEGFISSAILDMSTITTFGVLIGAIIVDGVVIGVLPEATYADLQEVIDAVVAAINGGIYGYQATDNGDNTITLQAPGAGTEANGFIVTVQINPSFILDKSISVAPKAYNQIIYIDAPGSFFDGYTVVASNATGGPSLTANTVTAFKGSATSSANFITIALPISIQGYAVSYDPDNDQIYVGGFGGSRRIGVIKPGFTYSSADDIIIPFTPGNPNPTDTLGFNRAYYNATNSCTYFTMPTNSGLYYQSRSILKLDSSGTQTQIIVLLNYQTSDMRIDPANGNMWLIPSTTGSVRNVKIMNVSDIVTLTIAPANYYPTAIAYYEGDGTVGSERMMIGFAPIAPALDYRIASYELDGTLDNANWYTGVGAITNIFYSSLFNIFFVTDAGDVNVLHADGTVKQSFVALGNNANGFVDDPVFKYVIGTGTQFLTPSNGVTNFYTLTNDGDESADGALEGGTPDVFMTEADQCVEEKYVNALIEYLKAQCGCDDCGDSGSGSVVPPPVTPTFLVYYGRSANTTLTNIQVEALTSVSSVTYAGSYLFSAVTPSSYCYVSYPASQGTPSRIYDASTGFDVAVDTVFQVTINSVIYNVYRTYYELGGEISITFVS